MKQLKNILAIGVGLFGAAILAGVVCVFCLPSFIVLIEMVFPHEQPAPRPEETIGSYQCITDVAYYGTFQDGMRYTEYFYSQVSFDKNPHFKQISPENREQVERFAEHFSWWVDTLKDRTGKDEEQFYTAYSYDLTSLSNDDFYYIHTDSEDYPLANYKLYIFDSQRMTLYYMDMH